MKLQTSSSILLVKSSMLVLLSWEQTQDRGTRLTAVSLTGLFGDKLIELQRPAQH